MDPVSVFDALYDTQCLTFAPADSRASEQTPYAINLHRLQLHPKLRNAIVNQVVEKFLTARKQTQASDSSSIAGSSDCTDIATDQSQQPTDQRVAASKLCPSVTSDDSYADSHLDEEIDTTSSSAEECELEKTICDQFEPVLCGTPASSVSPLAAAIAFKAKLPLLVSSEISAASLSEALGRLEVGEQEQPAHRSKQIVLIEDVVSDGHSLLEDVRRIESHGFTVELVICIVDRDENGILWLEQAGVRVLPLYNMGAILRILEITGRISSRQYVQTRTWIAKRQIQSSTAPKTIQTISRKSTLQSNSETTAPAIPVSAN